MVVGVVVALHISKSDLTDKLHLSPHHALVDTRTWISTGWDRLLAPARAVPFPVATRPETYWWPGNSLSASPTLVLLALHSAARPQLLVLSQRRLRTL